MTADNTAICEIAGGHRSEEHTSELQSQSNLVCRLLLEKKKNHALVEETRALAPDGSAPVTTSCPPVQVHLPLVPPPTSPARLPPPVLARTSLSVLRPPR